MIAKKYRFHGHGSLKFLFSKGKTERTPYFAVKYVKNPKREFYRLSVVVSKKVSKKAVVRNRIRRRLYELARKTLSPEQGHLDIAIIVYDERVATAENEALEKMLVPVLKKITTE